MAPPARNSLSLRIAATRAAGEVVVKRVLVVDDDAVTRRRLESILKKARHRVTTAADGAQALAQLRKQRFALMLLDVWMPGMTGLELLERLRDLPERPKVIVMTSDETPETILTAVRHEAFEYVHKPVDPNELVELVARALAAPPAPPIEVLSATPYWVELLVPCDRDAAERIQSFMLGLKADLPENVRATVGQAFHELLLNAVEWGGKLDPQRKVLVAYVRTPRLLIYRIADPGKGFRFEDLPHSALSNPKDEPFQHAMVREEKGLRPGGFGLLMTRTMVDELVYNEKQNEVLFVKYLDEN